MRFRHPLSLLLVGFVGLLSTSGCPLAAYLAAISQGPQEHKATYELKDEVTGGKVVVWVRAIPEELEARDVSVRDLLGRQVTAILKTDSKVPMISYDQVARLLRRRPVIAQATAQQVGRKVGAGKVIYIDVREFALRDTPRSNILRGRLHATVAIIDVASGAQDWPTGTEGHSVKHEDRTREPERGSQNAQIIREVIAASAEKIAKLFYTYTDPE